MNNAKKSESIGIHKILRQYRVECDDEQEWAEVLKVFEEHGYTQNFTEFRKDCSFNIVAIYDNEGDFYGGLCRGYTDKYENGCRGHRPVKLISAKKFLDLPQIQFKPGEFFTGDMGNGFRMMLDQESYLLVSENGSSKYFFDLISSFKFYPENREIPDHVKRVVRERYPQFANFSNKYLVVFKNLSTSYEFKDKENILMVISDG